MTAATTNRAAFEAAYHEWVAEMEAAGIGLDAYDHSLARRRFAERAERGLLHRSGVRMLTAARPTRRGDLAARREGVQRAAEEFWKGSEARRLTR